MTAKLFIPSGIKFRMASNGRCDGSGGGSGVDKARKDTEEMMDDRIEDDVLSGPGTRNKLAGTLDGLRPVSGSLISRMPDPPFFRHMREICSAHCRMAARRRESFLSFVTGVFKRIKHMTAQTLDGIGSD